MPKLFLVDLMSLFFRSHMAMERHHLTNGDGMIVSGISGVIRTLLTIERLEEPEAIVVCSDTTGKTFRHELYEEYKANRPPMADEMAAQLPHLYQLLNSAGLPVHTCQGYEADDLLATLAVRAREAGWQVFIVSSDKDLMQLVDERTFLYTTRRGGEIELVGADAVRAKFGVSPHQVGDLLALMGDASDNVPGVPKVGVKTAGKLISSYGSLDGIYENLEDLKGKAVGRQLAENEEQARLSRRLVELDTQAPCTVDLDKLPKKDWSSPELVEQMMNLGFRGLIQQAGKLSTRAASQSQEDAPAPAQEVDRVYHTVRSREEFSAFFNELRRDTDPSADSPAACAFDLETTSLDAHNCTIVGFSFSWKPGEAWYIPSRFPTGDDAEPGPNDELPLFEKRVEFDPVDLNWLLEQLRDWYEDANCRKLGQNCKYDINVLAQYGIHVRGVVFDTMLASYVIQPAGRQHNLDALSLRFLGESKIPTSELIGKGARAISMADVPLDRIAEYACEDADCVLRLWPLLQKELEKSDLGSLFQDIDLPTMQVLCGMEQNGVQVDVEQLTALGEELQEQMSVLQAEVFELAEEEFNINSPRQLASILYEKLGLKPGKKTSTGYSTDVRELERLADDHPLPQKLLEYRQLAKLKSTYVDALPRMVNPRSGRIHTSFNQTIAATGRLSSTDPNLQNIPVRSEWGRRIRDAFVARDTDHVLIDADYSQIELRVLAHISGDPELSRAFREGEDVHARTAAAIFGVSQEDVDGEMRAQAKVVNFGVIYGMSAYALAGNLGLPVGEAKRFIDEYFSLYAGVRSYVESTLEQAREQGWVANIFSRRRYLPDIQAANRQLRENTERIAVNTPIQGSAADLIKISMIHLAERIPREMPELQMISQVHDELLFEAPRHLAEEYALVIRQEMEHAYELDVPLVAEPGIGESWLKAK